MARLETLITRTIRYFQKLDRIWQVWYVIVIYVVFLIMTVFGYAVLDHDYYKKAADAQQKSIIKNPTSRGTIYSSKESLGWVLAVSTNLGTLAIDPTQTWSRDKLLTFLADVVFEEFCLRNRAVCMENLSAYLRTDLSNEKNLTEGVLKERIRNYIGTKMDTPIESVEVKANLDDETVDKITSLSEESLFFVANNLYVNPTKVANASLLGAKLSVVLAMEAEELLPKFTPRKRRHLQIIHKMSIGTRDIVNKRIDAEILAVKEKRMEKDNAIYPFLKIEDNLVRFYPEWSTLGQITGFIDAEWKWRYGIEGYFDEVLQIENPIQTVVKDIAGRPIRDYVSTDALTLKSGVDVTLTVDRNLQKELSKRLAAAVIDFRANKGSVVVMDPKTGAILAMVNYPDYDPNNFPEVYEMERVLYATYPNPAENLRWFPLYVEDTMSWTLSVNIEGKRFKLRSAEDAEIENFAITKYKFKNGFGIGTYQNDVVSSLYEPGSVFKAVTTAIGIETGEIKPDDVYYDRWYVELDIWAGIKRRISNVSSNCIGQHSFLHGLNWSCNVAMINIVERIGRALFYQYLVDFGFNSKTNITLDGEAFAQIGNYEKWSRTQLFTMSFGQGINVTMLQMAAAYSVIANWGIYMQPYIVESLRYPDGKVVETLPTPLRRVIKEETAKQVAAMLVDGVRNGFAKAGWVLGYTVAGKTGTSQIAFRWGYEVGEVGHTSTSFGGFAPAQNPKFVLIVRLERPRSALYSETTSSALFASIAKYLLEYYKVPKNTP
jgi:stage V sporulation protein D (sporulation-specific penicillin-binding protein)